MDGGGGNNDDVPVDPADPQMREQQPFTWIRAAPYIVVVLAGVALIAFGVSLICRSFSAAGGAADDGNKPAKNTFRGGCADLGYLVALVGGGIVFSGAFVGSAVFNRDCRVRRLD